MTAARFALALLVPLAAGPAFAADAESAAAVRKLLTDQVGAWNRGDLDGFMVAYWDSDDLTFFSGGTVTKGKKAVTERYRKNYQSDGKEMGKLTFSDLEVQVLGADAAVARGRWKVATSKETLEGLYTLTVRKLPAGWRITHDHTSK